MKPRVHAETSVINYCEKPSGVRRYYGWSSGDDLLVVETATVELRFSDFATRRQTGGGGRSGAAAWRLATLDGIPLLDANRPEVESLAEALIVNGALPMKAFVDA